MRELPQQTHRRTRARVARALAVEVLRVPTRDVFIYFISAAKHRNPAAAMALQERVDARH